MPVQRLALLAGMKIPFAQLKFVEQKNILPINMELGPYIRRTKATRRGSLKDLCRCNNSECLCYFEIIRNDAIQQWWANESDYVFLGDWLEFTEGA